MYLDQQLKKCVLFIDYLFYFTNNIIYNSKYEPCKSFYYGNIYKFTIRKLFLLLKEVLFNKTKIIYRIIFICIYVFQIILEN